MLVVILESIGVPSAGIALILGVDRPLDMLRTTNNITGDTMVASVIASSEGELDTPDGNGVAVGENAVIMEDAASQA
jgi:Na+/H+-dicarboxylate symporter